MLRIYFTVKRNKKGIDLVIYDTESKERMPSSVDEINEKAIRKRFHGYICDWRKFNIKAQMFLWNDEAGDWCNGILRKQRNFWQNLIGQNDIDTLSGLKYFMKHGSKKKNEALTIGDCIRERIGNILAETTGSSNGAYSTLLHTLDGTTAHKQGYQPLIYNGILLADIPVSAVDTTMMQALFRYVVTIQLGKGYDNKLKLIKCVLHEAQKKGLNSNLINWSAIPSRKLSASEKRKKSEEIHALTLDQYRKFVNADVTKLAENPTLYPVLEFVKDWLIFCYEAKCRPSDGLCIRYNELNGDVWSYLPVKLDSRISETVKVKLSETALAIICKYRTLYGQQLNGYVFKRVWGKNETWTNYNRDDCRQFKACLRHANEELNLYLKKFAGAVGVTPQLLINYIFRHSTITHRLLAGYNDYMLAKEAGTSVEMFRKTYFNWLNDSKHMTIDEYEATLKDIYSNYLASL